MLRFQLLTNNILNFNLWFSILLIVIFIAVLIIPIFCGKLFSWLSYKSASRRYYRAVKQTAETDDGTEIRDTVKSKNPLDELISSVGYAYSEKNDVFFSTMYAWQRGMGYCRLYDEAAAPLGMIIDCEPVHFSYAGKRWLIEFWKGQYGMTSGCEVGVYNTEWPNLNIPGVFDGTFYNCASNNERLYMGFILYKNGEELMKRKDNHWWLTGFKLGEYSEPSDLSMDVYINFTSRIMRDAFLGGLKKIGYTEEEYELQGRTVIIKYDKPHTKQPYTRNASTDKLTLNNLKALCESYQTLTKGYKSMKGKVTAVKEKDPDLYLELLKIGKTASIFNIFGKLKDFLNIETDDFQ